MNCYMKIIKLLLLIIFVGGAAHGEDGYRLWLRFDKIKNVTLLQQYRNAVSGLHITGKSATIQLASDELQTALSGLLDRPLAVHAKPENGSLLVATKPEAST